VSLLAAAVLGGPWLLGLEGGYGPRYERSSVASDPRRAFSTHEVARAGTLGFVVGRAFGPFVAVASARAPLFFDGEWTLGLGGGFELKPAPPFRVGALATFGWGGFTANSCECGRLSYSGPFARGDVTFRYRVLADAIGEQHPLPGFEVYFGAAVGVTVMQARYPDMSQYGLALDDVGTRVGPHATLAMGFEL